MSCVPASATPLIKIAYRDGNRYRFVVARGFDRFELVNAYEQFLRLEPGGHVLWDLTEGGLQVLSSSDVRDLACDIGLVRGRHAGGRLALVCPCDIDYGIARMLAIYGDTYADPPVVIQAFRDADEAWCWLSDANS